MGKKEPQETESKRLECGRLCECLFDNNPIHNHAARTFDGDGTLNGCVTAPRLAVVATIAAIKFEAQILEHDVFNEVARSGFDDTSYRYLVKASRKRIQSKISND